MDRIEQTLLDAVAATQGHFHYESGHHGDLWLDLDTLFVDAQRVRSWASALARQAADCRPDVVCGPLTGGAFIAQAIALEMDVDFVFAERFVSEEGPVNYRVPESLREILRDQRVLLVDDAINAGSALRLTIANLLTCGSELAGFAGLLTLGEAASRLAAQHGVPFFSLASLERNLWTPAECPLCASNVPLINRFKLSKTYE